MKILIVDDEPDVEMVFRQKFRSEVKSGDFVLEFAHSATEAIEYLGSHEPMDFVLVLSDINMPGLSGLEMLKQIKEKFAHLRVFMLSAYGDQKNKSEARELGAEGFFVKPVDFNLLKEQIKTKPN